MKLKDNIFKNSIRTKLTAAFAVLLFVTVLACCIFNILFLDDYYILEKKEVLISVYNKMRLAAEQEILEKGKMDKELAGLSDTYSLDIMVLDTDSNIVKYIGKDEEEMRFRIWDRLFLNITGEDSNYEVIEKNSSYELSIAMDPRKNSEYLELWGIINNQMPTLIRIPLGSIKESANIANKMIIYTGFAAIIVGAFVIWFVSRKITKPIMELADISKRMANLEFDVKYEGHGGDELGVLGDNINKLSASLEKNISNLKSANIELTKDIERREKLDEMRCEFLANVSHELKTPIALIQGYGEGLKEGIYDDPENRDYYLDVICDEASKMNTLVKNLMALNQLEFGRDTVEMERFDILDLIGGCVQSVGLLLEQKGINITYTGGEPVYVWGDEFKIEEVIVNFLSNAINHCEGEKNIDIKVEKIHGKVKTTVFNTGQQIPEDSLEHIWEKFYKVDKARTRAYGGSGIGLSIVKAIMDSMNQETGVINYDNGVAFYFTLDGKDC